MKTSICITGVAGSGKSAVSDELKRLGYSSHGIEEGYGLFAMVHKETGKISDTFDNDNQEWVKQHRWICDKNKLQKLIDDNPQKIAFYCGIASNIDELLPLFDKVFLLKANEKILSERLTTRTSNDFGRTPEVQKWVFSWKEERENDMCKKGAIIIDANNNLEKVVAEILKQSN
ncbi:MAG: AAA family ATPase [candidate division SR1 bacterium]|nr:AAA family ATPase [candidate division SR1 bacterium]